jgi:hypothetical protein
MEWYCFFFNVTINDQTQDIDALFLSIYIIFGGFNGTQVIDATIWMEVIFKDLVGNFKSW